MNDRKNIDMSFGARLYIEDSLSQERKRILAYMRRYEDEITYEEAERLHDICDSLDIAQKYMEDYTDFVFNKNLR